MSFRNYAVWIALVVSALMIAPASAKEGNNDDAEKPVAADENTKEESEPTDDAKPDGEEPAEKKKPAPEPDRATPKPETHKVAREPLVVKLSLDGVFEARRMHELALRPESWSSFKVVQAAEHGDHVAKGQVLVRFETDDIDRALADLKRDIELNTLTFTVAELELQTLERLAPMNLSAAALQLQHAQEDLQFYLETDAPFSRRTADAMLDQVRQALEYQREELAQLEKMYRADELTEETEQIVLRRAKNAVERAEFMLERAEVYHERTVEVELARREKSVKKSADRTIAQSELLQEVLPLRLEQARAELEKARIARQRSEERLAKLQADRELMTIQSPADGVVYYGRSVDGSWRRGASATNLQPGGSIPANDVFITIVEPRPLRVRTSVVERHLADLQRGLQGTATPTGFPQLKLPVRLERIAKVPDAGTKFDAVFRVRLGLEADPIMPGMTCKMEFTPYRQRGALVVPPKAVFTDEWNPQRKYVWLYREGAKPRRRTVVLGRQVDDKAEVLEGLEAGDKILLKAPDSDQK